MIKWNTHEMLHLNTQMLALVFKPCTSHPINDQNHNQHYMTFPLTTYKIYTYYSGRQHASMVYFYAATKQYRSHTNLVCTLPIYGWFNHKSVTTQPPKCSATRKKYYLSTVSQLPLQHSNVLLNIFLDTLKICMVLSNKWFTLSQSTLHELCKLTVHSIPR